MTSASVPSETSGDRGFRLMPHTADCIVEAWGPDRAACLAEAVDALVSVFAQVPDAAATTLLPVALDPAPDPDLLVELLEEVIYTVDVFGKVPTSAHLIEGEDGGLAGDLETVDAADVVLIGPLPKGVSWHGLRIGDDGGTWRCHAILDV